jgi:hypothetical protein
MSTNPTVTFLARRSSFLALISFMSAMLARIFPSIGLPGITKFMHFSLTLVCFVAILPHINLERSRSLLYGLLLLLWAIAISALVNSAGLLNVILDFLILSEPFMLLILIMNEKMSQHIVKRWRLCLVALVLLHSSMAYYHFVTVGFINPDLVKGLFLEQGAGHHVAGAVALTAAVYLWARFKISIPIRLAICILLSGVVIVSDSKQVVGVFLVSLGAMILAARKNLKVIIQYSTLSVLALGVFFIVALTVFPRLLLGTQLDRITNGIEVKTSVFPLIISNYTSPLNWVFGLGPGHTVGRLAEILPDYFQELEVLGATISPTTQRAIDLRESNYLSQMSSGPKGGSSLWSPFFSWAGNWGDLGIIGGGIHLSLWILVYRKFCVDDVSKFFLLNVFIFGLVFGWIEEPGYILFIAAIVGLNWQDHQSRHDPQSAQSQSM